MVHKSDVNEEAGQLTIICCILCPENRHPVIQAGASFCWVFPLFPPLSPGIQTYRLLHFVGFSSFRTRRHATGSSKVQTGSERIWDRCKQDPSHLTPRHTLLQRESVSLLQCNQYPILYWTHQRTTLDTWQQNSSEYVHARTWTWTWTWTWTQWDRNSCISTLHQCQLCTRLLQRAHASADVKIWTLKCSSKDIYKSVDYVGVAAFGKTIGIALMPAGHSMMLVAS